MDNEEYIASGMLELYAAGALSLEERQEVERAAAGSPAVRAALEEACAVMGQYAALHAVQPRPALKERILHQIEAQASSPAAVAAGEQTVRPLYPVGETRERSAYKWMFAASVALFLLSGFMSLRFYRNWQGAEQRLSQALASQQTLAQNYQTASHQLDQQQQALRVLRDGGFRTVRLEGVEAQPDVNVMVYWKPEERRVYVEALRLPPPPAGRQYQLWALLDGKPIDAGMIETEGSGARMQQMKQIGAAQAFAITLEPEGGSVNPTMEQLCAMGEVSS